MHNPTTKTEIAKWAVQAVVANRAAAVVADQVSERTELDRDGLTVEVGSACVGYFIASKAKPYTDKAVDCVIQRYQSWRQKDEQEQTSE